MRAVDDDERGPAPTSGTRSRTSSVPEVARRAGKRAVDIVVATALIAMLAPVFAVVAVLVRVTIGSPVLFRQPRPGRDEQLFEIVKFRTMADTVDADGVLLDDRDRLTSTGSWLRRLSLDELPNLFNVLRGEMSIVGPRPLLVRYLPVYTDVERERFRVRPGMTGPVQIAGRRRLDWDDRLAADVDYVRTQSLALDLRIMAKTLRNIVRPDSLPPEDGSKFLDVARSTANRAGESTDGGAGE